MFSGELAQPQCLAHCQSIGHLFEYPEPILSTSFVISKLLYFFHPMLSDLTAAPKLISVIHIFFILSSYLLVM